MFRGMFLDFFRRKEEKPPEYDKGPFFRLTFIPSDNKWKAYGDDGYLGEFNHIGFRGWEVPFPVNEAIAWINVTTEEEEPYYDYYYESKKSKISFTQVGTPIVEFKAGEGYRFWCKIVKYGLSNMLYFIVWKM